MKRKAQNLFLTKYKYAVAVLILGILLLALPGKGSYAGTDQSENYDAFMQRAQTEEKRLQSVLEQIEGVGKTKVLLSCASTEEHAYVKDSGETVLVSAGSGREEPLEKKTLCPEYLGAVVVCEGAEDAKTQLRVIEAVCQFTGLRTDQISVLPLA